jgi:hypothetical protein
MRTGRQVTDAQVKQLRRFLNQGASLQDAAMKSGMDRKTARKYRTLNQLPSEDPTPHTWRTRPDPLAAVWPRLEEWLRREPRLQAKTLVDWLQREYPSQDWQRQRRTVERRVRTWKAQHGCAKEVFFSQVHEPGRLGSSDFTHMGSLNITLQGQAFDHLLYHFVLTYSNWEDVTICFSESFASLSEGLQNALWQLGAVPKRHRTDRMTLAVHRDGNAEQFTANYRALMRHYGIAAEATNPASGHENGDCEQGHRRFKESLEQELLLRGSRDFDSREQYVQFLRTLVTRRNLGRQEKFANEQPQLHPLPKQRLETMERQRARVGQGSTIKIKKNIYSVPARLIGESVEARIGAEVIEVWYQGSLVQTMERLRGQSKHRIDYRHVIDWLVRKPGAFARYVYREDLYPSVIYRRAYDTLQAQAQAQQRTEGANREYVRILYLAAQQGESLVAEALAQLLDAPQRALLSEQAVRTLLGAQTPLGVAAQVSVPMVDLRLYDALLDGVSAADQGGSESFEEQNKEKSDEQGRGRQGGADALLARPATGDDADAARGGGAPGHGGIMELREIPAGTAGAGMPAEATQPD